MPAPPTLRLALFFLVADGVLALYLAEFLGPRGAAVVAALLILSWWGERLRRRLGGRIPGGRALVPIAAAASAVDTLYLAETVLDGLVRLLLFLVLYKLFTLGSVREARPVTFLAFFMLVAASSSAFGVGFLGVFLAFVALVTWATLLQHALSESEPGPGRTIVGADLSGWRGRALLRLALVASVGIVVITAGLFFVLPRIGLAALPLRARLAQMVTGFSDRVELGAYGSIATNATVVMRVHVPEGSDDPEYLPNIRWRGIALDQFDGRAWSVGHPRRMRLLRMRGIGVELGPLRGARPILRQEIYLEPLGTEVIFAASRVVRLGIQADVISIDDMESMAAPPPTARLHYTVDSELEDAVAPSALPATLDIARRSGAAPLDPWARDRFLQLPPLAARIPALARQVAAGSRHPYEAALRLTEFLSREFRYTLTLPRTTTLDPVDEFLFVSRAGNCEYFAASLAVMLRSLGIPARVVNGFQRGEWNPFGRYFMVRLRDAHSWVEAHVDGAGWVTLDPSPRAQADGWAPAGTAALYLDALRLRWHRYVIHWSLRDQLYAAGTIRRHAATWGPRLGSAMKALRSEDLARGLGWAIAVGGAGLAALFLWRDRAGPGRRAAARPPRFYERALRIAARRGLRPGSGETAREFSARVGEARPTWAAAFARLTAEYERCRFGAAMPTAGDLARLDACLASLERGAS